MLLHVHVCMYYTHYTRTYLLSPQVSRLQTALDIAREVYERVKGELQKPFEDYLLYWPRQKVLIPPSIIMCSVCRFTPCASIHVYIYSGVMDNVPAICISLEETLVIILISLHTYIIMGLVFVYIHLVRITFMCLG